MKKAAFLLTVLGLCVSCRTTDDIHFSKKGAVIRATPVKDGSLSITVAAPTHIDSEKGAINTDLSYAQDAKGKK